MDDFQPVPLCSLQLRAWPVVDPARVPLQTRHPNFWKRAINLLQEFASAWANAGRLIEAQAGMEPQTEATKKRMPIDQQGKLRS